MSFPRSLGFVVVLLAVVCPRAGWAQSDGGPEIGMPDTSPDAGLFDATPDGRPLYLYGGGSCACEVGGPATGGGMLLILGLVGLLLVRTLARRDRPRHFRWLPLLLLLLPQPARAQFPVTNFQLAAGSHGFYVTENASTQPSFAPSAALLLHYAHQPLELWDRSTGSTVSELIQYQINMDLLLAMGLGDHFELGLALPVTLAQSSEDNAVQTGVIRSAVGAGLGDLRLVPKLRVARRGPVSLALALALGLPTGSSENLLGGDGVTITPRAAVTINTDPVSLGFNIGLRVRNDRSLQVSEAQGRVTLNDDLLLSLALRLALVPGYLDLVVDSFLSVAVQEQDTEELSVETLAGLRYRLPRGFTVNVGAGPGLTRGVGTPMFRMFAGVGYQYGLRHR